MAIVTLILAAIALVLIGVGIAVGLAICALAVALVGLGVISSSVVVGIFSGRAADGFRVFLMQCGVIAGVPVGVLFALLANSAVVELQGVADWPVIVGGGLVGGLAGIAVALLLHLMSERLRTWAALRLKQDSP